MPYIGRDLNRGNYLKLDDISSSFNGSTQTFNLTVGGSAFTPGSAFSILVSLGGVIQEPESAYQVNNSEITFANAPTAQDSFFCIALGVSLGIGVPGNSTVNGTQMAKPFNYDGFFYLNDSSNRVGINSSSPTVALDVVGDLNVSGNITGIGGTLGGTLTGNVHATSGISTFNDLLVNGDLTVEGDTTTLNTTLRNVELLRVSAASTLPAGIVTQTGTGDILRLYDGSNKEFSVTDGGTVYVSQSMAFQQSDRATTAGLLGRGSLLLAGTQQTDFAIRSAPHNSNLVLGVGVTERLRIASDGKIGINTTDASHLLTVFAQSTSSNLARFKAFNGNSNFDIHTDASSHGQAYVRNNIGAIKVALNSNGDSYFTGGNVGIGTDNPSGLTHWLAPSDMNLYLRSANSTGTIRWNYEDEGGTARANHAFVNYGNGKSDFFTWATHDGSSLAERLRISKEGNIGIGTNDPGRLLTLFNNDQPVFQITNNTSGTADTKGSIFYQMSGTTTLAIDNQGDGTGGNIQFMAAGSYTASITSDGDVGVARSIFHLGDTNTSIGFPAADTVQFITGGSESLRINSNGHILKGHTAPSADLHDSQTTVGRSPRFQLHGAEAVTAGLALISWKSGTGSYYSPNIYLARSGSDTVGTNGLVANSAPLGAINFSGDDGGEFAKAAVILGEVDGTSGADDMPGRLIFKTTPSGTQVPLERLRIASDGDVSIGSTADALRRVDVVGNSLLVRPTIDNVGSSGNASAVNNSIIIRMPYGENPATTNHGGARFGIQFTGANNTTDQATLNFGNDPWKSASIYGVSEDVLGYNRKVGIAFYTSPNDAAQEEQVRITGDGKVGVNTASPDGQFHIHQSSAGSVTAATDANDLVVESSANVGMSFLTGATSLSRIKFGDTTATNRGIFIFNHNDQSFRFQHTSNERLRIDKDGKVGISTGTIDPDGNPLLIRAASTVGTTKGHIMLTGDGATVNEGPQIVFSESGSGSNFAGAYIGHERKGTNSIGDLVFGTRQTAGDANTVPSERLRIQSDGKIFVNHTSNSEATVVIAGLTDNTHPVIKVKGTQVNGYSFLGDEYKTDESQFTMGCAYSAASFVLGWGVKVSTDTNNKYMSTQDTYNTKHGAFKYDGSGLRYLTNTTNQTVTTDSEVTLTERLNLAPDGLITIKGFNGTGLRLEGSGSDYQGVQLKVTDASDSQTRNVFIDAVNENGNAVANQVGAIQADGGSMWAWSTQEPANNRNDRRAERLRITANGTAEFYGGTGSTPQIKVQSEEGGAGLFFANYQGVSDTGDTARLGVGMNDNALIFMNASGSQVQNFAIGTTDPVPLVFSTSNTPRVKIESTGKFVLNNGAAEYASGTITNVDQDVWYVANPTIQWSTYAVVGAIIMVCYEDNNADGHNLGAYFVGPATSAYAGMTTTPFHKLHGSSNLEVKIDQVGGTGTEKLHFRCTHSSANGNSNKFLRWTIIRAHSH